MVSRNSKVQQFFFLFYSYLFIYLLSFFKILFVYLFIYFYFFFFFFFCWLSPGLVVLPRLGRQLYHNIREKSVCLIFQDELLLVWLIYSLRVSTSVLADSFSLEFEWQQVSSSLQDSSQYSGRSQQCCHLDSLYPSANFQVLQDYYYYYLLIRVFHISVSWGHFTGDWVKASLLKSPGLFSVFWRFSIMLLFGWSPLGRQLPNFPGPLIIL